MKAKKKISVEVDNNKETEDMKLSKRVIDLFIWYQIEDSNAWLRVLESQVKFLEERRKQLFKEFDNCLFKFQKKKVNEELEKIEKELFKQYENIGEEVSIINNFFDDLKNLIEKKDLYANHVYHLTLEKIKAKKKILGLKLVD